MCAGLDGHPVYLMHSPDSQWRNWQGASRSPGKQNVKTVSPLVDILLFSIV